MGSSKYHSSSSKQREPSSTPSSSTFRVEATREHERHSDHGHRRSPYEDHNSNHGRPRRDDRNEGHSSYGSSYSMGRYGRTYDRMDDFLGSNTENLLPALESRCSNAREQIHQFDQFENASRRGQAQAHGRHHYARDEDVARNQLTMDNLHSLRSARDTRQHSERSLTSDSRYSHHQSRHSSDHHESGRGSSGKSARNDSDGGHSGDGTSSRSGRDGSRSYDDRRSHRSHHASYHESHQY